MSEKCDILLTGGIVVTMDDERRILEPGAVAVSGDRIAAVGSVEELSEYKADKVIDCTGQVVIPGLIDCHNHLFQLLGRGLGEGMALWPWLCEFMWPYSEHITQAQTLAGVQLAALEAVSSGTTCVVDNHYAPNDYDTALKVAQTVENVGMRGAIAHGITGYMTEVATKHGLSKALFQRTDQEDLDICEQLVKERLDSLVQVWPAPLNIIYNGQDLVVKSVELAKKYGTRWHSHCSEAELDPVIYLDAYGIRPIAWLHKEGLLDQDATIAHGIWLDDEEVEMMGDTKGRISYNPMSNEYLASGPMRLQDLKKAGAVLGMGTDGSAGHRADMFQVMKQAVYVQRLHTLDPESCTAMEAFELATRGGAEYYGLDAGELSVGKLADIAVVDIRKPYLQPLHDVVSVLVYSATGADVTNTIVNGKLVYADGKSTTVDEQEVVDEACARAQELVRAAGFKSRLA